MGDIFFAHTGKSYNVQAIESRVPRHYGDQLRAPMEPLGPLKHYRIVGFRKGAVLQLFQETPIDFFPIWLGDIIYALKIRFAYIAEMMR